MSELVRRVLFSVVAAPLAIWIVLAGGAPLAALLAIVAASTASATTATRAGRRAKSPRYCACTTSGMSPASAIPTSSSGRWPAARAIRKNSQAPSAHTTASSAASGAPPTSTISSARGAATTAKRMRSVSSDIGAGAIARVRLP